MDPLSLSASIITLLAAGGTVIRGLERLSSLRAAPNIILALNIEISDFRLAILELSNSLQREPVKSNNILWNTQAFRTELLPILHRARNKLIELESLIEYRLILPEKNGSIRLNKTAWLWERQKLKMLQKEFRSIKINVIALTGVLITQSMSRIELQTSDIRSAISTLQGAVMHRSESTTNAFSASENFLRQMLENEARNQSRIESYLREALATANAFPPTRSSPSSLQRTASTHDHGYERITTGGPPKSYTLCTLSRLQWRHSNCILSCTCRCHNRAVWASPNWINAFFGRLSAEYTRPPFWPHSCDKSGCLQSSGSFIAVQYIFPSWFAFRVLHAYLQAGHHSSIEYNLRVFPTIWSGSEIFVKARSGDVAGVKALLESRRCSPFDVSEEGQTALMVSGAIYVSYVKN